MTFIFIFKKYSFFADPPHYKLIDFDRQKIIYIAQIFYKDPFMIITVFNGVRLGKS